MHGQVSTASEEGGDTQCRGARQLCTVQGQLSTCDAEMRAKYARAQRADGAARPGREEPALALAWSQGLCHPHPDAVGTARWRSAVQRSGTMREATRETTGRSA